MKIKKDFRGAALLEIIVAVSVFLVFSIGVYSGINVIFKIVYASRMRILGTSILSEEIEVIRNFSYEQVGIQDGIPKGVLPHEKIVNRNNKNFRVITTVRYIDDPYDGVLGGSPNDTSPADYKLVELSAICIDCVQASPEVLSTIVSPKGLEGESQNGALFITVFDADGDAVPGAQVHVVNTNFEPDLVVNDATDNFGMLRMIDVPTGTLSYNILVTKPGYSTDQTNVSVPGTPTKMPATVVSQSITDVFFSIDELGSLALKTIDQHCTAVGNISFNMRGEKLIGTNPNSYKFDNNYSTDDVGVKNFSGLENDKYHYVLTDGNYDIAGSVPMLPLDLTPGLSQSMFLIVYPHTENSLLVKVRDAGTKLPLSNVTIHLYNENYDETLITDLGYSRQTDWSGGSGQTDFIFEDQYFSDSGTLSVNSPAGDLKLKKIGSHYLMNGQLESSTFDFGDPVNFNNIIPQPLSQPSEAGEDPIVFQIATSERAEPENWDFVGPDGTSATFYNFANTQIWDGHNGKQYLRYKVFLNTADDSYSPILSEVAFTYVNSCMPPGQNFFSGLSAGSYNLDVSRAGYSMNGGQIEVSGTNETIVDLSTE